MKTEIVGLTIDGRQIQVPAGTSILESAREAEIYIPRLCYHPDLPPAIGSTAAEFVFQNDFKIENSLPKEAGRGCGICVPFCTGMAIELENYEFEPMSKKVEEEVSKVDPKFVIFGCQWSEFRMLDDIHEDALPDDVGFIELPCSGRVDPLHVLEAFQKGADGVLVITCPEELCRLEEGSRHSHHRIEALKGILEEAGVNPEKLQVMEATPRIIGSFLMAIDEFKTKMAEVAAGGGGEE